MKSTLFAAFTAGVASGCLLHSYVTAKAVSEEPSDSAIEEEEEEEEEYDDAASIQIPRPRRCPATDSKIVVGVRTDMKLSLAETASCLSDVVIKCVAESIRSGSEYIGQWYYYGQTKVCTKVQSRAMMDDLIAKATDEKVLFETLSYKNDIAAFAVGPAPIASVDRVTKHLKLL